MKQISSKLKAPLNVALIQLQEIRRKGGSLVFKSYLLLFRLFDNNRAISYQGGRGAKRRPQWQQYHPNHAYREGKLEQGIPSFRFDDDAANVAFVHYLFDFMDKIVAGDMILLCSNLFLAHHFTPLLLVDIR